MGSHGTSETCPPYGLYLLPGEVTKCTLSRCQEQRPVDDHTFSNPFLINNWTKSVYLFIFVKYILTATSDLYLLAVLQILSKKINAMNLKNKLEKPFS